MSAEFMTEQDIFDKVLTHLRAQGKAAYEGESCRYRTTDGLMCAVGCLIPDDKYSEALEGGAVDLGHDEFVYALPQVPVRAEHLLLDLQRVHDRVLQWRGLAAWELAMAGVAASHFLTYTPPAQA